MGIFTSGYQGMVVCVWPDRSEEADEAVDSFATGVERLGYEVRDAVSTPQAIQLIAHGKPDLVYVHNDPSTMATLIEDSNFSRHYKPLMDVGLEGVVLFERK